MTIIYLWCCSLVLWNSIVYGDRGLREAPYWYIAAENGDDSAENLLPYSYNNVTLGSSEGSSIIDVRSEDSSEVVGGDEDTKDALLFTAKYPYGIEGEYRDVCEGYIKCGPGYACVAPTGIPRCMEVNYLKDPFNNKHIVDAGHPHHHVIVTPFKLNPLEWQFTPGETHEIVEEAKEHTVKTRSAQVHTVSNIFRNKPRRPTDSNGSSQSEGDEIKNSETKVRVNAKRKSARPHRRNPLPTLVQAQGQPISRSRSGGLRGGAQGHRTGSSDDNSDDK